MILILALLIGAFWLMVSIAAAARRKWRGVRGIQRNYWFDEWIL